MSNERIGTIDVYDEVSGTGTILPDGKSKSIPFDMLNFCTVAVKEGGKSPEISEFPAVNRDEIATGVKVVFIGQFQQVYCFSLLKDWEIMNESLSPFCVAEH